MPDTAISDAWVFPEDEGTGASDGDYNDAADFAAAFDAIGLVDFVTQGLSFTPNYTTPAVDVGAGKAVISTTSASTIDHGTGAETRDEGVVFVVEVGAQAGIALTDSAVNYVRLALDLTADDTAYFHVDTDDTAPTDPSLRIGTIDTTADTATPEHRYPDMTTSTLSVEDSFRLPVVTSDPAGAAVGEMWYRSDLD